MCKRCSIIIIFMILVVSGCASTNVHTPTDRHALTADLVTASYIIADTLQKNLSQPLRPEDTLIVASFVDVNNLQQSSPAGRIIAEQVGSRFAQKGMKVVELKLRSGSVYMAERKGEFLLSRELQEVVRRHEPAAVIVGVYAEGFDKLYVSSRLIRSVDNVVISSADIGIPMSPYEMEMMVAGQ